MTMKTALYASSAILMIGAGIATSPAAAAQDAVEDGEIVVTATRGETLLSKTPIAMSAIDAQSLRDKGITDATAIEDVVPNVSLDLNGDALRIAIRGVTSTDATEKGDPSAAYLLDGIYIARPQDQLGTFFDVSRVEVLRGPQGTLYGRNTTAGVVNVITATPVDHFEAAFDGSYGALNALQATGMVNLPVSSTIALRAAVNVDRRDNYVEKGPPSDIPLNPYRDIVSGRLSVGIHLGESAKLIIRGDYSQQKGSLTAWVPLGNFFPSITTGVDPVYVDIGADKQRRLTYAEQFPNHRNFKSWGAMADFSWNLGAFQLFYLGSYRETQRDQVGNFFIFDSFNNPQTFTGDYWQTSHEVRAAFGQGNPLHGQVGLYYFKERSGIAAFLQAPIAQIIGGPNAVQFGFPQDPTISISKAAFGQFTYDLTLDLHLTGGVRYTIDEKSRRGATVLDFNDGTRQFLQINDAARKFKKTTWRVGVDYDAPGLGLLYASVSTGYKAGGFNDGCEAGPSAPAACALPAEALYYGPETLTAYEAGFKFKLLDNTLRLNGSVFHYDYKGLQLSQLSNVCGGPCQVTTNAARSKVDGAELEALIQPGPNDRIELAATWLDARYTRFDLTPTVSFAGRPLDHAPRYTATAGYTHSFPLGGGAVIEASGRLRFSDSYALASLDSQFQFIQPSFHKTDLTLTYRAPEQRWYLQAYAKNLENEITLSAAATGILAIATIEEPRTYGVRAGFRF